MPPTRQGFVEFEQTLIATLQNKSVSEAISKIIIQSVTAHFADKFKQYDEKIANLEAEISNIKTVYTTSSSDNYKKLEQTIDNIEQESKKNNIRLVGLGEVKNENLIEKVTDIFENKLNVNINQDDIAEIYRVGKSINNRPRQVMVKFRQSNMKTNIYSRKRMLKGSAYVIKEDLTHRRLELLKMTSNKYGFKNVWTIGGSIFARSENEVNKISI